MRRKPRITNITRLIMIIVATNTATIIITIITAQCIATTSRWSGA
jgi:hypothetical protein